MWKLDIHFHLYVGVMHTQSTCRCHAVLEAVQTYLTVRPLLDIPVSYIEYLVQLFFMSNCQQSRLCPYCCVYYQISVCMPYAYPHFVFVFLTGCKFLPCYYRKDRALQIRGNSRGFFWFFWGFFLGCF